MAEREKRHAEFLVGRLLEERQDWLSVDLRGELSRSGAKRLIQFLEYFRVVGRLPDPDVERRIRTHGIWKESELEEIRVGRRELEVCASCEHLCGGCWESCTKFRHSTTGLGEAHPTAQARILYEFDERLLRRREQEAMEARYPLPVERPDRTYVCQACRKTFASDTSDSGDRLVCGDWCMFDLTGHARIPGRKWSGFLTVWPCFKGGLVFYLGEAVLSYERLRCECYLWQMKPGGGGNIYAYHGEALNEYWCWVAGASANRGDEEAVLANGVKLDESWRILANMKDSYSWKA